MLPFGKWKEPGCNSIILPHLPCNGEYVVAEIVNGILGCIEAFLVPPDYLSLDCIRVEGRFLKRRQVICLFEVLNETVELLLLSPRRPSRVGQSTQTSSVSYTSAAWLAVKRRGYFRSAITL